MRLFVNPSWFLFAAELGQHAQRALRVQEADVEPFGAGTALLVDEAHTLVLGLVEGLVGVLHSEGNVVHATLAAVLLDEGGDGALGAGRLEELYLDVAAAEEGGLYFLVLDFLDGVALEAHNVFPIADSLVEIRNGNADVFNV